MSAVRLTAQEQKEAAPLTSDDLVGRAQAGDRSALQALLEANYDYIRKMLYRLVGTDSDLEDLQQTVLLRVATSLSHYRGDSAVTTWIGGICVHVARDHLRRKKTRSVVLPFADVEEHRNRVAGGSDAVDRMAARQGLDQLAAALQRLSVNHRTVFLLRAVYGHSIDEIAAMMKSAKSTTRLRLYYARKALHDALGDMGDKS